MTNTSTLANYPAARPLVAEQVTEFHAARLLLLLLLCGKNNRIEGLTKLAKLDFFVRYPAFFLRAKTYLGKNTTHDYPISKGVDSAMVRYHYGPWDKRYYQILGYLESRELIKVVQQGKTFVFLITENGTEIAQKLAEDVTYSSLCQHMREVQELLGNKNGDNLKKLVYELFDREVAKLPLGEVIRT